MRPYGVVPAWEVKAMANRHKRKQAELENDMLRRALYEQSSFLGSIKTTLIQSPSYFSDLNMRQLLHTYTQLTGSTSTRRRDLIEACTDSKLDLAMNVLLRETEDVDFSKPSISSRLIGSLRPHEFGVTTIATYAFDTLDLKKIFMGACAAVNESGLEWPQYSPVESSFQILEVPKENIRYGLSSIRFAHEFTGEQVVLETRPFSFYRLTTTWCVLVWDFVDVDEQFPLNQATHVKRDSCGA